jgi:hypothetical protein
VAEAAEVVAEAAEVVAEEVVAAGTSSSQARYR